MSSLGEVSQNPDIWRVSCSIFLMDSAIVLRNGPEEPQSCLERTFRLLGAELSFVLIALMSVVEAVFRASFTIPGIIVASSGCLERKTRDLIDEVTIAGPTISFLNTWVALAALVQNLCHERLRYNEILPCAQSFFDALPHLCDCFICYD